MIGYRLKALRQEKNLTIAELSQELDLSGSAISNYERDQRSPDAHIILKYVEYFDCTADYILGLSDVKNNTEKAEIEDLYSKFEASLSRLNPETREAHREFLCNIIEFIDYACENAYLLTEYYYLLSYFSHLLVTSSLILRVNKLYVDRKKPLSSEHENEIKDIYEGSYTLLRKEETEIASQLKTFINGLPTNIPLQKEVSAEDITNYLSILNAMTDTSPHSE